MIVFRADANGTIGAGHMMRCLSIAAALQEQGEEVCFITADAEPAKLLQEWGIRQEILHTDYRNLNAELTILRPLLQKLAPAWLVVDSYSADASYLQRVSEMTKIAYIDDYGTCAYPVDLVINYNIQADEGAYQSLYANQKSTQLLLGLPYVPLRSEFTNAAKAMETTEITDILLSNGAADPQNISLAVAQEWKKRGTGMAAGSLPTLHIVCGPFYRYYQELEREAARSTYPIMLHHNVIHMAELMSRCQLAIASTGSSIYELCAMGIPTVSYYFVENQRRIAEGFANKTPVSCMGNYQDNPQQVLERIWKRMQEYLASPVLREMDGRELQRLVDGCGAQRIAGYLMEGANACQRAKK